MPRKAKEKIDENEIIDEKNSAEKKSKVKKTSSKKADDTKATTKKATTKKSEDSKSTKKTSTKKTSTKKVEDEKTSTKKASTKKAEDKKTTTKKGSTKKSDDEKATTKRASTKKSEDAKTTTKKASTKKIEDTTDTTTPVKKRTRKTVSKAEKEILEKENTSDKIETKKDTKKASTSKASKTSKKSTTTSKATKTTKSTKSKEKSATSKSTSTRKRASKKIVEDENSPVQVLEYYDLPYKYGNTVVKLLAQTPKTLFVYWEVSDNDIANFKQNYGDDFFNKTKPILIVHNITLNKTSEIEINDFANCWYLNTEDSDCKFDIELARKFINSSDNTIANTDNSEYLYLAKSNSIQSPNNRILFEKLKEFVVFRNVKTGSTIKKHIKSFKFLKDIYRFYKDMYDEDILNNPSSQFKL